MAQRTVLRDQLDPRHRAEPRVTAQHTRSSARLDLRVVLFTFADGRLLAALRPSDTEADLTTWGLPRGLPVAGEPLDTAARRIVRASTGLTEQYLEQLYTLSADDHLSDPWSIIISYMALILTGRGPVPNGATHWHDVRELPSMSLADQRVIEYALVRLQAKLSYTNIAFFLLPETFTLSELQRAYETVLQRELDKRNFRRRVIAASILEQAEGKWREGSHRPAALYRFRAEHDRETYLTPPWASGA